MIDLYNLKMKDVEFKIDKENRTIECVINGTETMFYDYLHSELLNYYKPIIKMNPNYAWKIVRMPNSFSGKAICAEGDEWDEALGRMIAFDRMKLKIASSFVNAANRYARVVERQLDECYSNIEQYMNRLADNADRRGGIIARGLGDA